MLSEFENKIAGFIKANAIFDSADRILLAVSGGADSTALYYERAYQWDPDTIYPARFKAAYIWDKRLAIRRADALENYQEILKRGGLSTKRKEFIEKRIMELTQSERSGE
ncbi:unnamed protein product [marine sediment metagenome]|uniref:Uncharacterized protein n=1 Tax=marine sediment metagenome TaxID=412755 RepID=X1VG68_9ZZZZ